MIVAVTATRNEHDIIECFLRHLLAEGVDRILVADRSPPGEGTRETLIELAEETGKIEWFDDPDPNFRQSAVMSDLAHQAWERGATWVLPCDADEFWYAPETTIAATLAECSHDKLFVEHWYHRDWDHRYTLYNNSPKVAFRARPNPPVGVGNHYHTFGDATPGPEGVLYLRELQFRSYAHYRAKIADRVKSAYEEQLARSQQPGSGGDQVIRGLLDQYGQQGRTDEEIRALWESSEDKWPCFNRPHVYDPIPSRILIRPRPWA